MSNILKQYRVAGEDKNVRVINSNSMIKQFFADSISHPADSYTGISSDAQSSLEKTKSLSPDTWESGFNDGINAAVVTEIDVSAEKERLLEEAKLEADSILDKAKADASRLLDEAKQRAQILSVVGLNNLNHKQIHFIVSAINELNSMYDFIIIDTGAGVSEQVMEFVAASNEIVLVTTPEPTSITDSYSLLKALYKRPDFDPSKVCIRVISNRAASKEDGSIVFNKINSVVMQFLNGSLEYLGYVPSDAMVEKAVRQQKILSIYDPTSKAARSFEEIAKRLLDNESAALDEKRTISHIFSNFFNRKQ